MYLDIEEGKFLLYSILKFGNKYGFYKILQFDEVFNLIKLFVVIVYN